MYTLGLTADQRRTELGRRIRNISARTGITHTRIVRWSIELHDDAAQAQAQASVCEVQFSPISFLIFQLIEQACGS